MVGPGFVQNYEGWHNDVQRWFHVVCVAVFLGTFLRIVGWPQRYDLGVTESDGPTVCSYETFERSSEATPGEGEKLLPQRVNVTTERHFWYWCARCQEFVKGKHRYHCKTCMRCSTGFDHHWCCQHLPLYMYIAVARALLRPVSFRYHKNDVSSLAQTAICGSCADNWCSCSHYLNTCINDSNYTAWFVMCFVWLVVCTTSVSVERSSL